MDPYVPTLRHPRQQRAGTRGFIHVLSSTDNPEPVTLETGTSNKVRVFGFKAFVSGKGTNNSGSVRVGFFQAYQPNVLTAGSAATLECPAGQLKDVNKLWVQGASTDGIYVEIDDQPNTDP